MLKKLPLFLILFVVLFVGITQKGALIDMIMQGGAPAVVISLLLLTICVFFPIVPFPVSAGTIGAIFGTIEGTIITLCGSMIGTIILFFTIRYGFREWAQKKLKKYPKIQEYEDYLSRRSFLAILTARLIPIIPAPVINIVCGLSKVDWKIFIIASTIGKVPYMAVLCYAGANLQQNIWYSVFI
jgi:uncharacterized membrane protein YdjX (TVP38/TMEM64 family)